MQLDQRKQTGHELRVLPNPLYAPEENPNLRFYLDSVLLFSALKIQCSSKKQPL
jgi:hypothetical protein